MDVFLVNFFFSSQDLFILTLLIFVCSSDITNIGLRFDVSPLMPWYCKFSFYTPFYYGWHLLYVRFRLLLPTSLFPSALRCTLQSCLQTILVYPHQKSIAFQPWLPHCGKDFIDILVEGIVSMSRQNFFVPLSFSSLFISSPCKSSFLFSVKHSKAYRPSGFIYYCVVVTECLVGYFWFVASVLKLTLGPVPIS